MLIVTFLACACFIAALCFAQAVALVAPYFGARMWGIS